MKLGLKHNVKQSSNFVYFLIGGFFSLLAQTDPTNNMMGLINTNSTNLIMTNYPITNTSTHVESTSNREDKISEPNRLETNLVQTNQQLPPPRRSDLSQTDQILQRTTSTNVTVPFDRFRVFVQRNIFDPTRQPYQPPRRIPPDTSPTQTPPTPDYLGPYGVMVYDTNTFIFFTGSQADWKGIFTPGQSVGAFKIEAATTKVVYLTDENGQSIELPVGKALVLSSTTGQWQIGDFPGQRLSASPGRGDTRARAQREATRTITSTSRTSSYSIPDELLQRLIERRKKELGE